MDLIEITVEALTAVFQHPHTHKYKNHVFKYAAQILGKFDKILDVERNQQDMNKVTYQTFALLSQFNYNILGCGSHFIWFSNNNR